MHLSSGSRAAAEFFARISRELMDEPDELPTLRRIAARAVLAVPGCDHCAISVRRRRHRVETPAATSQIAVRCDALQYELGEGPCLQAIWQHDRHVTGDTATDDRWPEWGPRASREGIGSVLSVRLATCSETLGAINLYAEQVDAYDSDDVDLALIYAVHASNAMNAARAVTGLQSAVASRHTIGVAQGILMQSYGIGLEQSFEVLRRISSETNTKLRDLAAEIVAAGGLLDYELGKCAET